MGCQELPHIDVDMAFTVMVYPRNQRAEIGHSYLDAMLLYLGDLCEQVVSVKRHLKVEEVIYHVRDTFRWGNTKVDYDKIILINLTPTGGGK
jgi:hypothetical protein